MTFSPDKLLQSLSSLDGCSNYCVALSGGMDSVVLLHALAELQKSGRLPDTQKLSAIHINHQLSDRAAAWQVFCEELCSTLNIALSTEKIAVPRDSGEGLESAARSARYAAFAAHLEPGDVLLLAHHLDDQMETLLLRLMRGSGPGGLAGIPLQRELGKARLYRPLLAYSRQQLKDYAAQARLHWQEDDSNQNVDFDRNFCRHELLPLIQTRWPSYRESWTKAARLAGEADLLLTELAQLDLDSAVGRDASVIDLAALLNLSQPRQRSALRLWLLDGGVPNCGWNMLQKLTGELIPAADDATAVFQGEEFQIRRFRNRLYLLQSLPVVKLPGHVEWDANKNRCFALSANGSLSANKSIGVGLKLQDCETLAIRYREGGEECQLAGRPTKSLKKLMQEYHLSPWLRDRLPLLFIDQDLACVPGIGVAEKFSVAANQPGLAIVWKQPDLRYEAKEI